MAIWFIAGPRRVASSLPQTAQRLPGLTARLLRACGMNAYRDDYHHRRKYQPDPEGVCFRCHHLISLLPPPIARNELQSPEASRYRQETTTATRCLAGILGAGVERPLSKHCRSRPGESEMTRSTPRKTSDRREDRATLAAFSAIQTATPRGAVWTILHRSSAATAFLILMSGAVRDS